MDRNTILAVILCIIVITVGMTIQSTFFSPEYSEEVATATTDATISESVSSGDEIPVFKADGKVSSTDPFIVENEAMSVTFDPNGASVSSIKLKKHLEDGEPVEIILHDSVGRNAFLLYADKDVSYSITAPFEHKVEDRGDLTVVSFSQKFTSEKSSYEVVKQFAFAKGEEYLFQVALSIKTPDGSILPFSSYALGYDTQVGPAFESLNGNYDYRRMYTKLTDKGSKKLVSIKKSNSYVEEKQLDWACLSGKYFTIIGIPSQSEGIETVFKQSVDDSVLTQTDSFYFRRNVNSSSISDVYSFYCGPKLTSVLNMYDLEKDNTFGLHDLKLNKAMDTSTWLGWLETILKWILNIFYKVIPNYGVAIILLTILIKLILQPFSKKGMESTAKMAALQPQMTALQEKYKDDPEQLNLAISKLYKEEGINPMGSCIPMLIQFPVFIALYGLLNNHFELRGAMFIPGWITDLSVPETVFTLPFSIPFLGPQIHLLPILYTFSMIFSMKITQTSSTQSAQAGTMAFMTYGMPIIFFFILYNAPSGLLLYWSVMNVISIGQQIVVNKKKVGKFEAEIKAKNDLKKEKKKGRR